MAYHWAKPSIRELPHSLKHILLTLLQCGQENVALTGKMGMACSEISNIIPCTLSSRSPQNSLIRAKTLKVIYSKF